MKSSRANSQRWERSGSSSSSRSWGRGRSFPPTKHLAAGEASEMWAGSSQLQEAPKCPGWLAAGWKQRLQGGESKLLRDARGVMIFATSGHV